ncbi:MAG: DNA polymerase III subunit delta [Gammaproteobacteria bacterium]|nr:DNA polymerase III subunit delta [Gammaproteobacteria bacterium]
MKLRPDQLLQQLKEHSRGPGGGAAQKPPAAARLASVYLVSGDEPLLVNEVTDAIRAAAVSSGCDERESHVVERSFSWDAVMASLRNLSLFSAGKLVEIRLPTPTPGDEGSRALRQLAGREPDGNIVVVVTPALTRKTAESAWASALAAAGVWVETRPPELSELPQWIARRFRAAGLGCDAEGLDLLAGRVEGNLLAAQQEIDKLALLHPPGTALDAAQIRAAVAGGARFDVFQLGDAALAGDVERAVRVLGGLREEGTAAPLVLWSLVRETLVLVDAGVRASRDGSAARGVQGAGVWQSRSDLYIRALRNHKPGALRRLLRMAGRADQIVKGARPGEPWNALLELTLALAGRPLRGAELT